MQLSDKWLVAFVVFCFYNNCLQKYSYILLLLQENIDTFLKVCAKFGVPDEDRFQTEDLFYSNNLAKVILTLFSLSNALAGQYSHLPRLDSSFIEVCPAASHRIFFPPIHIDSNL